MIDSILLRTTEPESYSHVMNFTGAATAALVKNFGKGVTVTRTGVGLFTITFAEAPGNLIGISGSGFQGTGVSGFTVLEGTFVLQVGATKATLTFSVLGPTQVATDVPATAKFSLDVRFKRAGVTV